MKSNEIYVTNGSVCREEVLKEVEKFADYQELRGKRRIHLRLLAEELLGLVNEITGKFYAYFSLSSDDENYYLNLEAEANIDPDKKEELLRSSSSGKNAAAKGISGKIRDLFETYLSGITAQPSYIRPDDYYSFGAESISTFGASNVWSLAQYKSMVNSNADNDRYSEAWDELERSIIANIADDVSVGIIGNSVKIIITMKK